MIGLRWKIGPDWNSYLDIFNYTKQFSIERSVLHQDPGFILLLVAVHRFHEPLWVLNLAAGAIFISGLTAFSLRQPNRWLAMLVAFPYLVIVIGMSGVRQSIAIGILCFALNAFEKKRVKTFSLLILIAALFHGSVILMLPICLFSYSHNTFQRLIIFASGVFAAFFIFQDVFDSYLERYSLENLQSLGTSYRLGMNLLTAFIFLFYQNKLNIEIFEKKLWRNISICTILLLLLLPVVPSSTAIDRFVLYLFPLQMFVLSRVPKLFGSKPTVANPVTLMVIGYAALVQVVFLQFGTFANYYLPYRSIFSA